MAKKKIEIDEKKVIELLGLAPSTLAQLTHRLGFKTELEKSAVGRTLQRLKRERRVRQEKIIGWVVQVVCPKCDGKGVIE